MSNKYEQLIDFIINEDEAQARELFHQIVVQKSREIYESLIDEQDLEEIGGNEVEDLVDEVSADESGMEEGHNDGMNDPGMGDAEEGEEMNMDMATDYDADDHHADVGGNEEMEDRVMDLEDALDQLKAEFDALMTDEAGEEEHNDGMNDPEMGMGMDMDDDADEEMGESPEAELARLREYVEKVAGVSNTEGGDGKAGPVAGKNDMGGSAKNIAQSADEKGRAAPKAQTIASGNRNVPGGKADKLETAPKAKSGE